ncbi:polymer-forming cytoskeletal protein [Halobacillus sp. A1]|uniref:polymer-forming cytoskeletal protein n=1 Tax=Halobacillus sp. A1 TaxID=2880262 RepID=UPI0020A6AE76|nr:polymer-forming cytoskeletal protein [Halobacillus sp. A1]MCP3032508.1 polymer-forming cytoskeletal protein [Halobacillus sp. A1]
MVQTSKRDLILSGHSESGGGSFIKVEINGHGAIHGDVECENFKCNGSAKIHGDISSRQAVINGSTKVQGDFSSDEIKIYGDAAIEGHAFFQKMEINGHARTKQSIKGDHILLAGMMKVAGDCEVEKAELNGAFTIDGLLNADQVEISLHGKSSVKDIGGEVITVKRNRHPILHLDKLIKTLSKELQANVIEGDVVKLQYTKAKVVRGNTVEIGPGCEIEYVEYSTDLQVSEKAVVEKSEKL